MGGSAPNTTIAASTCGTSSRVVIVFPAKTEPMPGVSTRHIPEERSGLGRKTSTASTPSLFSEFLSSET